MLENKLPELLKSTHNIKILVNANYRAKETLAAKGLTPAIFLHRFYNHKNPGSLEVSYTFKDRQTRGMPDFCTIDIEDYDFCRKSGDGEEVSEDKLNKLIENQMAHEQIKFDKNSDTSVFANYSTVEKFLNNQSFHWFDKSNKMLYHALSLSHSSSKVSTIDQPMGVAYIIEILEDKKGRDAFEKVRNETELLLRRIYELNLSHLKSLTTMVILIFDASKGVSLKNASDESNIITNQFGIHRSMIYRLEIHDEESHASTEWAYFSRPILHHRFTLKLSDPVKLINAEEFEKVQEAVDHHRGLIRQMIENRLDVLIKKYEEVNKTSNKLMNFFKGSSAVADKNYTPEELEMRELADKLFLLEDFKKSYDIYKSLSSKLKNRNNLIEANLAQSIQKCLAMARYFNLKLRGDHYGSIQKYASALLRQLTARSRLRNIRYAIFLVHVFHTFKNYHRAFIKEVFYPNIKVILQQFNISMGFVYEQYANLNLLYPRSIDHRKYCYDLTRVASRFSDAKMHQYSLRIFFIVCNMYSNCFPIIEKYNSVQMSNALLENRHYRDSLGYLKKALRILTDNSVLHQEEEIKKLVELFKKVVGEIRKAAPEQLQVLAEPHLKIPVVSALSLQTLDEVLAHDRKSGHKWQDIGQYFLDNKQLMSQGLPQAMFRNIFRTFDTGIPEDKYMIHKFKGPQGNQAVLSKNSRNCYVNEPIRISFYFRNPIDCPIEIENVQLIFKNSPPLKIESVKAEPTIKALESAKFSFDVTPLQPCFLELLAINWSIMKVPSQFRIKEPAEVKSNYRSCYCKLNVHAGTGRLQSVGKFKEFYYEGERSQMRIELKNTGTHKIDRIYIAVGDEQMFGFTSKQLQLELEPNQSREQILNISLPTMSPTALSSQQQKITKILILYKCSDKFRISRIISKFNILLVAKLCDFMCERLSTQLYLLSFSRRTIEMKRPSAQLEEMVFPKNYQIVKMEAAELAEQTNYFFFVKKGEYIQQKYEFIQNASMFIYPMEFRCSAYSDQQLRNQLEVKFLWRLQDQYGCIAPELIPVVINQHSCLSKKFHVNAKLTYPNQLAHDFSKQAYLQIPICLKLKNVFDAESIKITVYFNESKDSDTTFQGLSQRQFNLSEKQQIKIEISLIVVHSGIYDISDMIKYTIENSKKMHINVRHVEYERVYIIVKNEETQHPNTDFSQFDDLLSQPSSVLTLGENTVELIMQNTKQKSHSHQKHSQISQSTGLYTAEPIQIERSNTNDNQSLI